MKRLTAEQKHSILIHLQSRGEGVKAEAIAAAHGVQGGSSTLNKWLKKWDGTAQSLQRNKVSGRPRALSRAQVSRHLKPRVLAANRRGQAVHYPTLLPLVNAATRKKLSLRTLQRYGREDLSIKQRRSKKRTATESKHRRHSHLTRVMLAVGNAG